MAARETREFITKLNDSLWKTSGNFLLTIYIYVWLSFLYHMFFHWDILVWFELLCNIQLVIQLQEQKYAIWMWCMSNPLPFLCKPEFRVCKFLQ